MLKREKRFHCGQECINAACRYLEVRREMMKSPEGRKALLEGVPDVVIEVAELEHILQASTSMALQHVHLIKCPQMRVALQLHGC